MPQMLAALEAKENIRQLVVPRCYYVRLIATATNPIKSALVMFRLHKPMIVEEIEHANANNLGSLAILRQVQKPGFRSLAPYRQGNRVRRDCECIPSFTLICLAD